MFLQASARASGGTSPTLTVVVKQGAVTIASMVVTAGAVTEAVLSAPAIPDEAEITIDTIIGGTSPTWDDIAIVMGVRQA